VALHAEALSEAMRRSRQQIVAAREEERRRIRRNLHDGLASVLTGVAFQADTVVALADREPQRAAAFAEEIRAGVTTAIDDVRRLINELRPTVLDDHGLVEGVRRHAARLAGPHLAITISGDAGANLPAGVEVAAYTILIETLTNIARHSQATAAHITLDQSGTDLRFVVEDNGPNTAPWTPGIGLRSMTERAEELGGELTVTPSPQGARIAARLPLTTPM
jgi:signal transduction histidine kinase